MPITHSAKKALRQSLKRRERNLQRKKTVKLLTKEIQELVDDHKIEEARKKLPGLYKALDKTAKKGTIKKNTASRRKSRLTILINKAAKAPKEKKKKH